MYENLGAWEIWIGDELHGLRFTLESALFFDPILSHDRRLACAGCHDPERVFTDGRARSVGVFGRVGTRSVPTLVNRAYGRSFLRLS